MIIILKLKLSKYDKPKPKIIIRTAAKGTGLKILMPKEMLQRLARALAPAKARNISIY